MDSDTTITKVDYPKLEGRDNYPLWAKHTTNHLKSRLLWNFVNPDKIEEPEQEEDETIKEYKLRLEKHEGKKGEAMNVILTACIPSIALELLSIDDPREAWIYLRNQLSIHGPAFRVRLYNDWSSYAFNGKVIDSYCQGYIRRWREMREQLQVDEEIGVYEFLRRMRPYYPQFVSSFYEKTRNTPEARLAGLESVMSQLREEAQRVSTINAASNLSLTTALPPKQGQGQSPGLKKIQTQNQNQSRSRFAFESGVKCDHCQLNGHQSTNCYKLHPELWDEYKKYQASRAKSNNIGSSSSSSSSSKDPTPAVSAAASTATTNDSETPWTAHTRKYFSTRLMGIDKMQ